MSRLFFVLLAFCSLAHGQILIGHYFGNPGTAAIPQYQAFANTVGQAPALNIVFVDYRTPIFASDPAANQWSNNARFIANRMTEMCNALGLVDANGKFTLVPIVSVGLADEPTVYQSGKYSEPLGIAMMNDVAAGKYDTVFTQIVAAFRNKGFPKIYLRPGWEQNGVFYAWRVRSQVARDAYVAAWRHVATLAHQYEGIEIRTVWSPTASYANFGYFEELSYPGDDVVDVIAPDAYSPIYSATKFSGMPGFYFDWTTRQPVTLEAWYANFTNRKHVFDFPSSDQFNPSRGWGMPAAINFAIAHGKPFGLSETGTGNKGGTSSLNAGGPADDGEYAYYLLERLNQGKARGLTLEYVDIWAEPNASGSRFTGPNLPLEADAWRQFVKVLNSQGTNIAKGKLVTVSSTQNPTYIGGNAVDGADSTLWNSNAGNGLSQFIQIDLGSTYSINRVKLNWSTAYGVSYTLQLSDDGLAWRNIYSTSTGDGVVDDIQNLVGLGRYVRLSLSQSAKLNYSLKEFAVYP